MKHIVKQKKSVNGLFSVPGDKSISHRSIMFASIATGISEIEGFLTGEDCLATISCFREMGIKIEVNEDKVTVHGKGLRGLEAPKNILNVGNSGTTIRLISGLLAAQDFSCEITGDSSIQSRPMGRVITPLRQMGADITATNENFAPIKIKGSRLKGIEYTLPVASAQIKSAIILASLYADGKTTINEPIASRNHTEIMLNYMGASISNINGKIVSSWAMELDAKKMVIPGDISSAAYFLVAGSIIPDSKIIITNVGINFTRTGIVTALRDMGADIEIMNKRNMCGEVVADLQVKSAKLVGAKFSGAIIPRMIDEIPILAVAALFAEGTTVIKDAHELKVKESNRINSMVTELKKLGACITETEDGMIIEGGHKLTSTEVESYNDHRVAMSMAVAALAIDGEMIINDSECVDISFPNFFEYIEGL